MKSKKVVGVFACALACASISALANETNGWFEVSVSENELTLSHVSTNGAAITIEDNKIKLENDVSSPLSFVPDPALATTNKSDGLVVICATAELTPSSTNDLDGASLAGAKAGLAVGIDENNVTNYYGFANGAWNKLEGVAPPDSGDTEFKLVIDYRFENVKFYVKPSGGSETQIGNAGGYAIATASTLAGIDAFGSGSISSISTGFEVAVAIGKDGNRYGSVVEAVNTTGSAAIKVVDAETGEEASVQTAANGLQKWECDVLNVAEDATVSLTPATKAVAGKITLQLAESNTPDPGVTVKFAVSKDGGMASGAYDFDCIEIPLEDGTYTIVPAITAAP